MYSGFSITLYAHDEIHHCLYELAVSVCSLRSSKPLCSISQFGFLGSCVLSKLPQFSAVTIGPFFWSYGSGRIVLLLQQQSTYTQAVKAKWCALPLLRHQQNSCSILESLSKPISRHCPTVHSPDTALLAAGSSVLLHGQSTGTDVLSSHLVTSSDAYQWGCIPIHHTLFIRVDLMDKVICVASYSHGWSYYWGHKLMSSASFKQTCGRVNILPYKMKY